VLEDALAVGWAEDGRVRLKKTVPRKIPTVTQKTPRFPQNTVLQPVARNAIDTHRAERSANITPPTGPSGKRSARPM